ncbi:hypothetical protein V8F20_007372 [Naviculisporaceae sp. PSN 640]
MSSEYEAWFAASQGGLWRVGDVSDDTFSVFDLYLSSEITAASATRQLFSGKTPTEKRRVRSETCLLVRMIAEFFPDAHSDLIELSRKICSVIDFDTFTFALQDGRDVLECTFNDLLSPEPPFRDPSTAIVTLKIRWTNFHTFVAKSSAAGVVDLAENFLIPVAKKSLEAKSPGFWKLRFYTPAAAAWLAYAAPSIWGIIRMESTDSREARQSTSNFNKERWEIWMIRLEQLRWQSGLDYETRSLLRQAFVAMERAERAL